MSLEAVCDICKKPCHKFSGYTIINIQNVGEYAYASNLRSLKDICNFCTVRLDSAVRKLMDEADAKS